MADACTPGPSTDAPKFIKNAVPEIPRYLEDACELLRTSDYYTLSLLKLLLCDGATGYGVSFTSSSVLVDDIVSDDKTVFTVYPFLEIFGKGYELLLDFFKVGVKPSNEKERKVLEKLTTFLAKIEEAELGLSAGVNPSKLAENDWMARLSVHVLSKLFVGEDYRLDSHCSKNLMQCPCPCKTALKYGVTSIGNPKTYYGRLDVIVGRFERKAVKAGAVGACEVHDTDSSDVIDEQDDLVDASNVEVKVSTLSSHMSQLLSQAIVFSFYLHKCNSEATFVPTIGISKESIQVHFYDSERDIYLMSREMRLFKRGTKELHLPTIVALWLVLNYSDLMTEATCEMQQEERFGFHTFSGQSTLQRYKRDIKLRPLDREPARYEDKVLSRSHIFRKRSSEAERVFQKYKKYSA
ncbi:hypothetical protein FSP39_016549 [Pinctada imbricata]|uniref:Uncharacterized protein n=1 Tax=Pinctada imbricata TaxID=66713 RepID=A0AA88XFP5_PINIB|nr:hypothetical protein FSP39_016549 [Pinctada imbricata]